MPVSERPEERRRTPRVSVVGSRLEIPTSSNVRVMDISGGGVLLASPRHVGPGQFAVLCVKLGDDRVHLDLEICRTDPGESATPGPFRLGAKLLPTNPAGAAAISRFLGTGER